MQTGGRDLLPPFKYKVVLKHKKTTVAGQQKHLEFFQRCILAVKTNPVMPPKLIYKTLCNYSFACRNRQLKSPPPPPPPPPYLHRSPEDIRNWREYDIPHEQSIESREGGILSVHGSRPPLLGHVVLNSIGLHTHQRPVCGHGGRRGATLLSALAASG